MSETPPPERRRLHCPCGVLLTAAGEDELVATVREHLRAEHPQLGPDPYTREQILAFAF